MEEEPAEDLPPSSEEQEGALRTSSTALEVEEEIIMPTSTSFEGEDEETILPMSTSPEEGEEEEGKETSLPPSEWETSESLVPQEQSPSDERSSSQPLESSELSSSSTASSPSTSPLSWKMPREGLQPLEEEEDKQESEEPTTDLSSILPQSSQLGVQKKGAKRKGAVVKKGALSYTVRPVVPAEKAELVSVAKAMHRENFGKNVKELFHLEKEAALKSIETGLYIGWRCPEYLWDCFRVGDESKCFCGHLLKQHQVYVERRATVPCTLPECKCQGFMFIPSCPEEVGEFWLQRRTGFDPAAWRAKCRCKHTHEEHVPTGARICNARGCSCRAFTSSFLCAACDRRWEEHETFFESEETRRKGGRPCGEAYLPFAEMPKLRNAVLTGCSEDNSAYQALPATSGSHALPLPPSGPRRIVEKDDKKA
ncbi:protein FAM221B [Rhineura floridana]|uniref:protein FAM221B n=1 Tax=Rhineura floridana TaxID=261503 RepID=UPI002AC86883|nr:protein FAM221B [Rhineura floridana]